MPNEITPISRRTFIKLSGILLPSACAPHDIVKIMPTMTDTTETPSPLPSNTQTATPKSTERNTSVPDSTPTVLENKDLFLETPVYTPPSLMLHSKDAPQLKHLLHNK